MPVSQQISAVLWGLGVGIASLVAIYMTVHGGWFRKPVTTTSTPDDVYPEPVQPVHEYAEGLSEAHGPIPLIVRFVIIGFVLFAIGYVVLFVQHGYTFS